MTVAERLRKEGEVRGEIRGEIKGEIKTYKKLLASGLLSKEMVEQKLAELNQKLENVKANSTSETEH